MLTSPPATEPLTIVLMVTAALPPAASDPRPQVTVAPASVQVGGPGTDDTKETPAGRLSTTVTAVASEGPRLPIARS